LREVGMGIFTRKFAEINREKTQECGGKAAHLGELTCMNLNVPRGFCVVAEAFSTHMEQNHLEGQISEIARGIDYEDYRGLDQKTAEIRSLIDNARMPAEIEEEITENYHNLVQSEREPFVAVRSSVAVKGSTLTSFPGMMDTFHYIKGAETVASYVKRCWASVWSARGASLRQKRGIEHSQAMIAPIVQKMVNARSAGVMFTLNPVNGDPSKVVIEGGWGLGESVVSGSLTPDQFIIDKVLLEINQRAVRIKKVEYVYNPDEGKVTYQDVGSDLQNKSCLEDREILELVKTARIIEEHYGRHQDIEWAIDNDFSFPDNIFILQSRAETIWNQRLKDPIIGEKSGYELLMERAMKTTKVKFS
jgi:pyruvate,water dikinase